MDELFYGERLRAANRNGDIFLATVDSVSSSGITLIFDGQQTASTKRYKMILNGLTPEVGDRVATVKQAGTYLILGVIGLANPGSDAYVRITGDTMTGKLTVASGGIEVTSGGLDVIAGGVDITAGDLHVNMEADVDAITEVVGTPPAANMRDGQFQFRDKLKTVLARINSFFGSDGRIGMQAMALRTVNGSEVSNSLGLYISSTGAKSVSISDPAAWRSALEIGTSGAFPLTIAQGGTGNTGTYTTTTVTDICAASSGFTISAAQYAQWGKIAMFWFRASVTTAVTSNVWTPVATFNSGKRPAGTVLVQELNKKLAVVYSSGEISVWGTLSSGASLEFSATYILS